LEITSCWQYLELASELKFGGSFAMQYLWLSYTKIDFLPSVSGFALETDTSVVP
jgi:hypothetical protein